MSHGHVLVPVRTCVLCKKDNPETEFYASELLKSRNRCKPCMRVLRQAHDKKTRRAASSFSASEVRLLKTLVDQLPQDPNYRALCKSEEFRGVAQKVVAMWRKSQGES